MFKKCCITLTAFFMLMCLSSCGNGGVLSPADSSTQGSSSTLESSVKQEISSQQANSSATQGATGETGSLSGDQALELAIQNAKVDSSAVKRTKIERDTERGIPVYEVGFDTDDGEYDYKIAVDGGAILDIDFEMHDSALRQAPSNPITIDQAKSLVTSQVPGAPEQDIRIWEEYDDGRTSFEGEFYFENAKYEFEIDASTGKMVHWSVEYSVSK